MWLAWDSQKKSRRLKRAQLRNVCFVAICLLCLRLRELRLKCCFSVSVKYVREVTPYFRKVSILSEIGWELDPNFLVKSESISNSNTSRRIPLLLALVTRGHTESDNENRLVRRLDCLCWKERIRFARLLRLLISIFRNSYFAHDLWHSRVGK